MDQQQQAQPQYASGQYLPDPQQQQQQQQYQNPQQFRAYDPQQQQQPQQQMQAAPGPYPYQYQQVPPPGAEYPPGAMIPQPPGQAPYYPYGAAAPGMYPMRPQMIQSNFTPKIITLKWGYQNTMCYGVEARGVPVLRRADNNLVNGTKLLKVAKLTRGRRDRILKSEKDRHVIKTGPMKFKGVWIPLERASTIAQREGIYYALYPLFEPNISELIEPLPRIEGQPIVPGEVPVTLSHAATGPTGPIIMNPQMTPQLNQGPGGPGPVPGPMPGYAPPPPGPAGQGPVH
ncbi:unnamed protein product [Ambrosiozyma monospora]|uniref:Unnamed protein product n=1 Tax=Ambrosiozyma monospora TaxID=43982 RepID=A0ACB5T8Q9_AMBMO|nr:unnamed protein product [Ambrosiozyma monospora]